MEYNSASIEKQWQKYWEENKLAYKTVTTYKLAIIWKEPKDINATDEELKSYYDANSFDFTDDNGRVLNFDEAKIKSNKS